MSSRWESVDEVACYKDIGKTAEELRKMCEADEIEHKYTGGRLDIQYTTEKGSKGNLRKRLVFKKKS